MTFTMRRVSPIFAALAVLLCASLLQAQSLADAARRSQQHSQATAKVYTNDNLPKDGIISVIGTRAAPSDNADAAPTAEQAKVTDSANPETQSSDEVSAVSTQEKAASDAKTEGAAASDAGEHNADLKKDAARLKENVSMLEREIDVSNREFRLRAATYYADAGNSLRNPKRWAEQQRDHDSEIKDKQAALDTAKQKLADLQEQARRVGVDIE